MANAYYVDRAYEKSFVDGSVRAGELLWRNVDAGVIDATANATASSARAIGGAWRGWAAGNVQGYALSLFVGVVLVMVAVWVGSGS